MNSEMKREREKRENQFTGNWTARLKNTAVPPLYANKNCLHQQKFTFAGSKLTKKTDEKWQSIGRQRRKEVNTKTSKNKKYIFVDKGESLYFANLNYLGMASQFIPVYARALQTQQQFTSQHLSEFTQTLL